jgi:hypothetical protein
MKVKLTLLQSEEILNSISLRLDTIESDPYSADEWETIDRLNNLKNKVKSALNILTKFTSEEYKWICEEIENRIEMLVDISNDPEVGIRAYATINSLKKLINV